MYIAGTRSGLDWASDLLIPLGLTSYTPRERTAAQYYSLYHPTRVVGHSLGGAVALDLAGVHHLESTTYGAPVASVTPGNRYRDYFDPVSLFDLGATNRLSYPHSYKGYL